MRNRRIGKFRIPFDMLKDFQLMIELQREMVVLRTEENHCDGLLTYYAEGPMFRETKFAEVTPQYSVTVTTENPDREGDELPVYSFTFSEV